MTNVEFQKNSLIYVHNKNENNKCLRATNDDQCITESLHSHTETVAVLGIFPLSDKVVLQHDMRKNYQNKLRVGGVN